MRNVDATKGTDFEEARRTYNAFDVIRRHIVRNKGIKSLERGDERTTLGLVMKRKRCALVSKRLDVQSDVQCDGRIL